MGTFRNGFLLRPALALAALLLVVGTAAFATEPARLAADCGAAKAGPVSWKFCVYTETGSRNQDVLYYFHGRGLDEKAWGDDGYYTGMVRKAWQAHGAGAPTVIAISFGKDWLLVPKNKSPYSGLLDAFTAAVVPTMEARIGGVKGRRILLGESMGGFNGTAVALRTTLFAKAALLCPPMTTLSPFATEAEIVAFIERTKASPEKVRGAIQLSRAFLPEPADYDAASPLQLAEKASSATPPLYVSCGSYDEYGFFEGAERFAATARARGTKVAWRPLQGGHCAVDIESVAAFLLR